MRKRNNRVISFVLTLMMLITAMAPLGSISAGAVDQVLDFVELAKTTKYVGSDYEVTVDDSGITITLTKDITNTGEGAYSCNLPEASTIIDVGSYGKMLNASTNGGTAVEGEGHYVMIPGGAFDVDNNPYLHAKITGASSNSADASWSFGLWYLGYQKSGTKKVSARCAADPEVFASLSGVTQNGNFIKGNLDYHSTVYSNYMIQNDRTIDFKYQALVLKVIGKAGDSFTISQFAFGPETLPSVDPAPTEPTELIYNFYSRYQIHQDGTYNPDDYHNPCLTVAECTYEKIAECNAKLNSYFNGTPKSNYTSPLPAKATGDWCVISQSPDNAFGVNNKDVGFFTVTANSSISFGIKVPVAGTYDMSSYMRAYNGAQGLIDVYVAPVSDKDNCMDAKYLVNTIDTYRNSGFAQSAEFKTAYDKAFDAGEYFVSFKMAGTSSQSGAASQAHAGVSGIVLTPSSAAAEAPTANPASGTIFSDTLDITLTSETPDAKIYYTTNGDEPTTSSTEYTAPVTLTQSTTIKAIAAKAGKENSPVATFTYMKKASLATAAPFNGFQFAEDSLNVKLSAVDGASIYYTVNGNTPTTESTLYSDGIIINNTTTIKALVVKDGMEDSDIAEFTYTKIAKTADPIVYDFRVFADVGTHTDLRTATDYTAVATANASLKTLSPSAMWCFGAAMDDATTVGSGDKGLGAAITPAGKWAAYRISVPQSGTYNIKNNFWNSGDTRYDGVVNYYFNPVSADPIAESGKIGTYAIGADAEIKNTQVTNTIVEDKYLEAGEYYYAVQLVDPGYTWNAQLILEPKNVVLDTVATPTATPAAGTYTSAQSVTLASATEGADIYYTTNGDAPTTSSTKYESAITVDATTTIKAIAVKSGMTNSDVAEFVYTIDTQQKAKPYIYDLDSINNVNRGKTNESVDVATITDYNVLASCIEEVKAAGKLGNIRNNAEWCFGGMADGVTFTQSDAGYGGLINKAKEQWASIKINVPSDGNYSVDSIASITSRTGYGGELEVYISPISAEDRMAAEHKLVTYDTSDAPDANQASDKKFTTISRIHLGEKTLTAGEYYVTFKMLGDKNLQWIRTIELAPLKADGLHPYHPDPALTYAESMDAEKSSAVPTIDGDLADWTLTQTLSELGKSDATDSKFDVKWDDTYIYVAADIKRAGALADSVFEDTGKLIVTEGTRVSFFFDPTAHQGLYENIIGASALTGKDLGDIQIVVSYNAADTSKAHISVGGSRPFPKQLMLQLNSKAALKANATGDGFVVEVAFRWKDLMINPQVGEYFGFEVFDEDNLKWASNGKDESFWNKSDNFGKVTLKEAAVVDDKLAAPTAVPADGTSFTTAPQTITLTAPVGGTIYYTTDGSDPKTSATAKKYTAPFEITTTTTVKAYAKAEVLAPVLNPYHPATPAAYSDTLNIDKVATAPTIDGVLDETTWKLTNSLKKVAIDGDYNVTGQTDTQSVFGMNWDDEYLYVGVKKHVGSGYTPKDTSAWDGDFIDVLVDPAAIKGSTTATLTASDGSPSKTALALGAGQIGIGYKDGVGANFFNANLPTMPEIAANSSAVVKMDGEFMIFEAKISFAAMGIKAVNSEYFGLNVLDDTTWSMWTVGGESSIGFWQTTRCTGKAVLRDSNASSIEGKTDSDVATFTYTINTTAQPKTQTYDWRIVSPYRRGTLGGSATNSNRNTVYAYEQVTSYDMIAEFVAETIAAGGKSGSGSDPSTDYPDGRVLESDPWMYGGAAGTLTGGKFNFTNEDGGAYLAKVGDWGSFLIKVDADGSYDLFNRMRFNGAYGGITEIYLAPKSEVSSAADTINSKYLIATVDQHLNRSATWGDSVAPLASNKALTAGEYYVTYKLKAESTAGSQTHTWIQYFKIVPHDDAAVKSGAPVFSPDSANQFESSLNVLIRAADQNDTSTYNKGKAFYKTGVADYYSSPESVIRMSTVPVHTGDPKDASPIPMSISETTTFAAVAMDYDADNKLFKTPSDVKAVTYTKKGAQEKVAAPTATPGAGTYTSTQNVTLASSTPDAEIYYTTNGSTPTTSSTKYTAAIPVSSTMTIRAIAVKAGMTDSDVAEFAYAINIPANRVKTPKANRDSTKIGGKYYVKLMCDTEGASIYYTTDGTEPTASSALWTDSTGHIEISKTTTLKVMATKPGMENSETATYQYEMLGVGDAKANRNFLTDFDSSQVIAKDGTKLTKNANGSITVSIDAAISDTETDVPEGGEGNRGVYIPVEAFNMAETPYLFYNIEASAGAKYAWTFMYDRVNPVTNEVVSKNHYQMMGRYYDANPTETVPNGDNRFFAGNKTGSFNIYTDYLRDRISRDGTLKLTGISIFVIGPKDSYININGLAFGSEMYSLPVLTPDKPLNSVYFAVVDNFDAKLVAGNTYPTTIKLLDADDKEISKTGATIKYTVTTGTDVVSISNTGVITATKAGSFTVKAEATLNGVTKSDSISGTVTAAPVTQKVATPTATPKAGTYPAAQSVTLSSATSGAEIYYTTNGSTPTTSSTKYSGAISVSATTTIKAIAVKSGMTNSDVATFAYTINIPVTKVVAPTATPAAGSYASAQSVTLSSTTAGAEIYYTTNGSTPTTASTKYTGAIAVDKSMTIKAIAVKSGMTNSDVASFNYVIDIPSTKVATPTTTPASGTYFSSAISVSLKCATDGAKIYYTLNGDTPKVDGESTHLYNDTPITVTATTTIKAIAVKDGMDDSDVMSAIFQYYVPSNNSGSNYGEREFASAPVANPRGGTYEEAQTVTLTSATEDAVIYYTTDGTNPTTSSTRYTDAITVDKSMTIKAIATKTGMYGSAVSSFSYTIGNSSIVVPPSEDTTFHDVSKSDWYYDAVTYVNEKGLFNGVSATEFGPNLSTTRAMLATVINRMAGNPTASGEAPFADVSSSDWFAAGVAWASETGIVNGIGNQKFAPNSPITREQLCAMLLRYAEYAKITLPETENITFNDADQISDYAKNAVDVMSKAGIIKGKNGGNFDPKGLATRAEVATMIYRFVEITSANSAE